MRLIGIDFETNGPEPEVCDITEGAWVMYDTDFGHVPVVSRCFLNKEVQTMDPVAEKITGISVERCQTFGIERHQIARYMEDDINEFKPDYMVAHNAHGFDEIIFNRLCKDYMWLNWIDTLEDLPTATYDRLGTRTLEFMAARAGFLNPFPHAALPDVMTMMKLLFMEDVDIVAERSKIPMVTLAANVSFEKKDLAKERRYFWENIRGRKYPKKWVKRMKKDEVEKEREEAPFDIAIIE